MRRVVSAGIAPAPAAEHGAHQVALLAPQLQQAAAVRLGDRVVRGAQVKEHAAVLKDRCGRMFNEIFFDALRELIRGEAARAAAIAASTSPARAQAVMCAV